MNKMSKQLCIEGANLLNEFTEREKICVMLIYNDDGATSLFKQANSREESILFLSLDRANNIDDLKFILWHISKEITDGFVSFTKIGGDPIDYYILGFNDDENISN